MVKVSALSGSLENDECYCWWDKDHIQKTWLDVESYYPEKLICPSCGREIGEIMCGDGEGESYFAIKTRCHKCGIGLIIEEKL